MVYKSTKRQTHMEPDN